MTNAAAASIRCRWCEQRHKPRFLCDPVSAILAALAARGMQGNMPSIEFPDHPIPAHQLGLGSSTEDRMVGQVVVQAATAEVAGVPRPGVVFTGRDVHGGVLPKWLYLATDEDLARLKDLVRDMADLAVRTAARARGA